MSKSTPSVEAETINSIYYINKTILRMKKADTTLTLEDLERLRRAFVLSISSLENLYIKLEPVIQDILKKKNQQLPS